MQQWGTGEDRLLFKDWHTVTGGYEDSSLVPKASWEIRKVVVITKMVSEAVPSLQGSKRGSHWTECEIFD